MFWGPAWPRVRSHGSQAMARGRSCSLCSSLYFGMCLIISVIRSFKKILWGCTEERDFALVEEIASKWFQRRSDNCGKGLKDRERGSPRVETNRRKSYLFPPGIPSRLVSYTGLCPYRWRPRGPAHVALSGGVRAAALIPQSQTHQGSPSLPSWLPSFCRGCIPQVLLSWNWTRIVSLQPAWLYIGENFNTTWIFGRSLFLSLYSTFFFFFFES